MVIDKDLDFTGKTVLVTGSGRSIGRAIVLEFTSRGANVIINSRTNEAEARRVEHEAQALGAKTLVVMGAAGELQTVEEMKRRAENKFGRVDIYVSNAARRLHKSFSSAAVSPMWSIPSLASRRGVVRAGTRPSGGRQPGPKLSPKGSLDGLGAAGPVHLRLVHPQ
jgi:NAD(P)-dependent dehydrogenase (short-subunit alcohol dehydrogenase family)